MGSARLKSASKVNWVPATCQLLSVSQCGVEFCQIKKKVCCFYWVLFEISEFVVNFTEF